MTRLAKAAHGRREMTLNRRALEAGVDRASTAAMREELIMVERRFAARLY